LKAASSSPFIGLPFVLIECGDDSNAGALVQVFFGDFCQFLKHVILIQLVFFLDDLKARLNVATGSPSLE
jgi:hypothetical protein